MRATRSLLIRPILFFNQESYISYNIKIKVICSLSPGLCTLTATVSFVLSIALWTWPSEAAEIGFLSIEIKISSIFLFKSSSINSIAKSPSKPGN